MSSHPPIILFTYNRPQHTLQTLKSLQKNTLRDKSKLYIFTDAPKSTNDQPQVDEVRQIITQEKWCKEVHIIQRETNYGLAKNIIEGVTEIVNQYGKVIVLEDDLVLSPGFLTYMNQALNLYQDTPEVMQISGHVPPIKLKRYSSTTFFYNKIATWGWGTWADSWQKLNTDTAYLLEQIKINNQIQEFNADGAYDFIEHLEANIEGKINTWAIKWQASVFLAKGLCLYPKKSLVRNIGFDNSGEHCGYSKLHLKQKIVGQLDIQKIPIEELSFIRQALNYHYYQLTLPPSFFEKVKTKVGKLLRI